MAFVTVCSATENEDQGVVFPFSFLLTSFPLLVCKKKKNHKSINIRTIVFLWRKWLCSCGDVKELQKGLSHSLCFPDNPFMGIILRQKRENSKVCAFE
jgi:hypothetical protein